MTASARDAKPSMTQPRPRITATRQKTCYRYTGRHRSLARFGRFAPISGPQTCLNSRWRWRTTSQRLETRPMSKYFAKRSGKYASKRESNRAAELQLLEKIGEISDLEEQVKFELIPKQDGERAVTYTA